MDRGRDRRVAVTEDADGNPVREVQVGLAVRVVEVVALAARPRSLEVATEDRRQVGCGQGGQVEPGGGGNSCGRGGHGIHGGSSGTSPAGPRHSGGLRRTWAEYIGVGSGPGRSAGPGNGPELLAGAASAITMSVLRSAVSNQALEALEHAISPVIWWQWAARKRSIAQPARSGPATVRSSDPCASASASRKSPTVSTQSPSGSARAADAAHGRDAQYAGGCWPDPVRPAAPRILRISATVSYTHLRAHET